MPENFTHDHGRGHITGCSLWLCLHAKGLETPRGPPLSKCISNMQLTSQSSSKQQSRYKTSNTYGVKKAAAQYLQHNITYLKRIFIHTMLHFTRMHSYSKTCNQHPRMDAYGRRWHEERGESHKNQRSLLLTNLRSKQKGSMFSIMPQRMCVYQEGGYKQS